MIGKRLRDLSASWIRSLRDTLQMFATIPRTHPNYPFPSDFPFSNAPLREKIHWIEEVGGRAMPYGFIVHFEYHLDTTNDWSPAIWIVRSGGTFPSELCITSLIDFDWTSAMSILGRVEIDYHILNDSDSPLTINADLVLEMMLQSLLREQPLRLSSRVISNSHPAVYPGLPGNIEIFELRTFSGTLVVEAARRMVTIRRCSICHRFLPPAGPSVCITHLLTT